MTSLATITDETAEQTGPESGLSGISPEPEATPETEVTPEALTLEQFQQMKQSMEEQIAALKGQLQQVVPRVEQEEAAKRQAALNEKLSAYEQVYRGSGLSEEEITSAMQHAALATLLEDHSVDGLAYVAQFYPGIVKAGQRNLAYELAEKSLGGNVPYAQVKAVVQDLLQYDSRALMEKALELHVRNLRAGNVQGVIASGAQRIEGGPRIAGSPSDAALLSAYSRGEIPWSERVRQMGKAQGLWD